MSNNDKLSNHFNSICTKNYPYSSVKKYKFIKGPWQEEEDIKLINWINVNGTKDWNSCATLIEGRTGKQCRDRWLYSLNPNCKKGEWANEEDYLIFKLVKKFGSKWSIIAKYIKGRNENSLKNRFYSTLRSTATRLNKDNTTIQESNLALNYNFSYNKKLSSTYLLNFFEKTYIEKTSEIDDKLSLAGFDSRQVIDIDLLNNVLFSNDQVHSAFNDVGFIKCNVMPYKHIKEADKIKNNLMPDLLNDSLPQFVNKIELYFNNSNEKDNKSLPFENSKNIQDDKNIDSLLAQLNSLEDKLLATKEEINKK